MITKFLRHLITGSLLALSLFMSFMTPVLAQDTRIPLSGEGFDNALTNGNILGRNLRDDVDTQDIIDRDGIISPELLGIANVVVGAIAIFFIVLIGVRMIFAQGDEGVMTQLKQQLVWLVVGLAVVSTAEFLAFDVLNPGQDADGGGLLEGATAIENLQGVVARVLSYLKYIVGGYIVMVGLMSGYRLVTGSSEDTLAQEKKVLQSFVAGLVIVFMAETAVMLMSLPDIQANATGSEIRQATGFWARVGIEQITGLINFLLSFLVAAGVFMLVWAGVYYATNFGNEEQMNRAKGIIIGTVIAMVIVLSSYTIVNLFVL